MSTANPISANIARRRGSIVRLSAAVAAVIATLALLDIFLARTEQRELASLASQADRNGQQLLAGGHAAEAVEAFRNAHDLERDNERYQLDLIRALMAAGKPAEAQPLMTEILDEDSNNGEANLLAARLAAAQGHINAADSYYHRAIYGEWGGEWRGNVAQRQIEARLELIDFLNAHRRQNEVLAELLPLEEQAGNNTKLQSKLAQLFLAAGSPSRAREIYRRLINLDPEDGGNYAGLGEADLLLGDFRAAHTAFSNAALHSGKDAALRGRLDLSLQLMNLDPTVRWLSAQEKYQRSRKILQLASDALEQCITNHPQLATDAASQLASAAQMAVRTPPPKQPNNEMAESTLSLSQDIWRARTSLCGTGTAPDEEALRLIMEKLAK